MILLTSPKFDKLVKKIHRNQHIDLEKALAIILKDPLIGEVKKGDLAGLRVYKFRMVNQLTLLAYDYVPDTETIMVHAFGPHENFYRDLK